MTMKAVTYTQYGPPEVLKLVDAEKPALQDNEVLVKVYATTVTAGDTRMRAFNVPPSYWLPARIALGIRGPRNPFPGMECAGVIAATGKNVTRFKVGDAIFASTIEQRISAYAEYITLPEDGLLALKPEKLSFAEAAALPIGGRTALYFLREAQIQAGQKVLIYGASGSVGTFAVQLAKYFAAEVTAVCSSANFDMVTALGADKVIDYTQEDFSQNGQTYDVIFDVVGKCSFAACMRSLQPGGAYLQAVASPGISLRMAWKSLTSDIKTVGGGPPPNAQDLVFLGEMAAAGKLKVVIDRCYPLEQIVEAHHYVDQGHKRGNVPIVIADLERAALI